MPPLPQQFPGAKTFFPRSIEKCKIFLKLLHVNNMWDFSLFIEQDVIDKKYIDFTEFVVLAVNWTTTVTNNKKSK